MRLGWVWVPWVGVGAMGECERVWMQQGVMAPWAPWAGVGTMGGCERVWTQRGGGG